ncbi:MAG: hypothetical protein ACJ8BF_04345 [Gemmatimonadales bacterium]
MLPSRKALLQITLPEVAGARLARASGKPDIQPVGVVLPAEAMTRQSMGKGTVTQQHAKAVFDKPGYYRVVAVVEDISGDAPVSNGIPVRPTVVKDLWLLVTDKGGKITKTFEPASVPAGVPTQSGQFRKVTPDATCGESCPPPCTGCACGGCANYFITFETIFQRWEGGSTGGWVYAPLTQAKLVIQTPTSTINTVTDNLGRYRISSCPTYPSTWTITVYNANADVAVWPRDVSYTATTIAVQATVTSSQCGKLVQYLATTPESFVFVNLAKAAPAARTFFGRSRPPINAYLHHLYGPDDLANYSEGPDDIEMYVNDFVGPRGVFVATHEYGHAYNHKALGGIQGGNCPSPHYFSGESGFPCAFSEGFADYFAAAIRGPDVGFYYDAIDASGTFAQGGAVEQAVAAFYFDVTDSVGGAAEPWDLIQYPGSYIAQLILTCEEFTIVGQFSAWNRARGIDTMIFCMERQIDRQAQSTYFFSGNDWYIWDFREGATEPGGATQTADVRRLWLHDLYMQ